MAFSWRGLNNAYQRKRLEDREDRQREEEIALSRENTLLELGLTKRRDRAKFRSSEPYREAAEAVMKLEERLKDITLVDDTQKNFFDKLKTDPFAVKDVFDFIEEQETKYNNPVKLPDLPLMIDIVTSNAPVDQQMDIIGQITSQSYSGEKGKQNFIDMASKLNDLVTTTGRNIFIDIKPGTRLDPVKVAQKEEAMIDMVINSIVGPALTYQINNDAEDIKLNGILEDVYSDNPAIKQRGLIQLFNYTPSGRNTSFGSPEELDKLIEVNPALKGFKETNIGKTIFQGYIYPTPNQRQIEELKNNPSMKDQFELKFGPGSADTYLP